MQQIKPEEPASQRLGRHNLPDQCGHDFPSKPLHLPKDTLSNRPKNSHAPSIAGSSTHLEKLPLKNLPSSQYYPINGTEETRNKAYSHMATILKLYDLEENTYKRKTVNRRKICGKS